MTVIRKTWATAKSGIRLNKAAGTFDGWSLLPGTESPLVILSWTTLLGETEMLSCGFASAKAITGEKDMEPKALLPSLSYAFGEMKLSRIYLRVASTNQAAIRCYEKAGFKKEGKLIRTKGAPKLRKIYLMRILKDEFYKLNPHLQLLAG